jgi:hypothetical protein
MQKFLIYDTDEGLDFNITCTPTDLPWVSCQIFRIQDKENAYFEVIKSEEYMLEDILTKKSIGIFASFNYAAKTAEFVANTYRTRHHWPKIKRIVH